MDLNFSLHPKQMEVYTSEARFKVVAAGRRFGKSYLAAVMLLLKALSAPSKIAKVWYIAPTYGQAEDIMWQMLLEIGGDLIVGKWKNKLTVQLFNGQFITLKGADKPDTLVGSGLWYTVLDEFADMKPEVWEQSIRPALTDYKGGALFIGTPEGLNHFYEVWLQGKTPEFREWESFQFNTLDNPIIDEAELTEAAMTMTKEMFAQEFEASFTADGGGDLDTKSLIYLPSSPEPGQLVMTVDPAGYGETKGLSKSKLSKLDETAIAICEVSTAGWFYHDIQHGRWDIRETSLRIVRAAQQYRPSKVGIESGSLKNAIMPYISDQQRRLNTFFKIHPLTHGGRAKTDRIMWSLQGRLQNGRIMLKEGQPWHKYIEQQMNDFPNPMAHDDGIDAMAYVDQLATVAYDFNTFRFDSEDWDDVYFEVD
jgi:predicted phage terminase large subunit-like protein